MRTATGLGLLFVGVWGIAYYINPHAFGSYARTSVGFAILSAMLTTGVGLIAAKRDKREEE